MICIHMNGCSSFKVIIEIVLWLTNIKMKFIGKWVKKWFISESEGRTIELFIIGSKLKHEPEGVTSFGIVSKNNPDGKHVFRQLYRDANIFVMPSLYEPFGIAFVEAMANRIPCIGTNNCAMPEIIEDGKCGFLVPINNSEILAMRIIELLRQPEIAKEMGEYCYKKYLEKYTWEVVANKVLHAVNTVFMRRTGFIPSLFLTIQLYSYLYKILSYWGKIWSIFLAFGR